MSAVRGPVDPPRPYRVGRQFAWVSSGRVLAALLQAFTMLLLIRAVSPEEFGFFSAAYGVMTVTQTLLDFGLPTFVVRERAKDRQSPLVTSALALNNRFSLALAILLLLLALTLAAIVDSRYLLLAPLAIWAAAERNADAWLGVVFADGDARINTSNLVARRIGHLVLFACLTRWTDIPALLAFGLAAASAAALSWLFAHVYVARRLPPGSGVAPVSLIKQSYPYWINSVATQARNLDSTVASLAAGTVQAGFYGAAARLTSPLRILPTSLATVLLPVATRKTSSTLGGLVRLVLLSVAALGVFYIGIALAMPWAVPVLLGSSYTGAVVALQITSVALIFASSASLLGALLQGVGLKHYVASVAVVTTCTCLGGVLAGAIYWGALGAALGLAASYVVQSSLLGVRLFRFISRKEPNR